MRTCNGISEYIEQDRSLEAANRVSRIIYDAIQSLRIMPYRGRLGRVDNTRELLVQRLPYVIVYEVFDERVLILNIGPRSSEVAQLKAGAVRRLARAITSE